MQTNKLILTIALAGLTLTSCEEEKKDEFSSLLEQIAMYKQQEREIFDFYVPDSIDKALIVTTYYDLDTKAHSVIVFADTNKKTAWNFNFLPDSTIQRDKLEQKNYNEFASISGGVQYIVTPKSVTKIVQSSVLSMTQENMRIDK